ncbi:uncharacterized protein LOC124482185 [Hypomesus transpacificus]|uniref:uncharacterized protein LOC124482185 n=1 Tax=Hypomesus transpacificus TaxID=137520 RepID=UPI001F0784D8|nr:uncharacterized protein LOC124482185 [Hypomesus transpacificus]
MDSPTPMKTQHRGMYPVDYPAAESSLFSSVSEDCMAALGSDHLHGQAKFQTPQASKVEVTQSNMVRLQVFEDQACFLLALHASEDDAQGPALHASEDDAKGPALHASEDDAQGPAQHPSEDNAQGPALHASEDDAQGPAQHASEDDAQGPAQHPSEDDAQGPAQHASEDDAQGPAQHPSEDDAQGPAQHASEDDAQGPAQHASEDDAQGPAQHASEDDAQGPAQHASEDDAQVVALHLHGRWWTVDDVLKTSQDRSGLVLVQSEVERVILFLLSQRVGEKLPEEETVFSPHPRMEMSKIFWLNKEAVGFYTVKQKGSLCDGCTSQSYVLPVLDTVLVRAHARRRGLGLQMLEDFCSSFPSEETLGVSAPISDSMAAVCRKYLQLHPSQKERLYEVEPPGGWGQIRNIWLNIQLRRCANDDKKRAGEKRAGEEEEERKQTGGEMEDMGVTAALLSDSKRIRLLDQT